MGKFCANQSRAHTIKLGKEDRAGLSLVRLFAPEGGKGGREMWPKKKECFGFWKPRALVRKVFQLKSSVKEGTTRMTCSYFLTSIRSWTTEESGCDSPCLAVVVTLQFLCCLK